LNTSQRTVAVGAARGVGTIASALMRYAGRVSAPGLALTVLLAGCASAPTTRDAAVAAARGCSELNAERLAAQDSRREAADKERAAWKAVIPVAVAARYASAKSKVAAADQRLAEINAESDRKGCRPT